MGSEMCIRDSLYVERAEANALNEDRLYELLKKMAFVSNIQITDEFPSSGSSFLSDNEKYFLEFEVEIDIEAEKERISGELEYAKGFVSSVERKLSNEKFVNGAPGAVVDKEKQKLEDGKERVRILEENLHDLMNTP